MAGSLLSRSLNLLFGALNRVVPWHRLPRLLAIFNIYAFLLRLRERNLYDTEDGTPTDEPLPDPRHRTARTLDGSFNDLKHPTRGKVGTRFARNVPLEHAYPKAEPALLTPNPRTVSRCLMTRDTFVPATTLNLLAAAWIQFQVHDWFNHGDNEEENP